MMWQITYQSEQGCVFWLRHCVLEVNAFDDFLQGPEAVCLHYAAGHDVLEELLLELRQNSMGQDALAEQMPETRDWAIGGELVEALRLTRPGIANVWKSCRSKFGVKPR